MTMTFFNLFDNPGPESTYRLVSFEYGLREYSACRTNHYTRGQRSKKCIRITCERHLWDETGESLDAEDTCRAQDEEAGVHDWEG